MTSTTLYKWSGAGNLFVIADCRAAALDACLQAGNPGADTAPLKDQQTTLAFLRDPKNIQNLCQQHSTDGLMLLLPPITTGCAFAMEFYNPDGSGGMMCGNGGRCIAAFAHYLGIVPNAQTEDIPANSAFCFDAPDGIHSALLLSQKADNEYIIRLQMVNVSGISQMLGGYFLNTGTRHFVKFVKDVSTVDVATEGKALRSNPAFAPEGTNVNFVSTAGQILNVRTFEKGVEAETMACGTGITACALVAYFAGIKPHFAASDGSVEYSIQARTDKLSVNFLPARKEEFKDIFLTGPAKLLAII